MDKGKLITIFGSTGDLGSQFADYLIKKNLPVQLVVRKGSFKKMKSRIKSYNRATILEVDSVLDINLLKRILRSSRIVFNFAGLVSLSFAENVLPNVLLINSLFPEVLSKINKYSRVPIIYASTQRVEVISQRSDVKLWMLKIIDAINNYLGKHWYKKNFEVCSLAFIRKLVSANKTPSGVNIYELSKALGEKATYCNVNSIILRISSCYGPGCSPRRTVGRLIFAKLLGVSISEKEETRDYVFAKDLCEIFSKIIFLKLDGACIYDCCSGFNCSKSILIKEINKNISKSEGKLGLIRAKGSLESFKPSNKWLKLALGKNPISIKNGIFETIKAYKNLYFSKNIMATHGRLAAQYDIIKQKTDEQGLSANEVCRVRDTFFSKSHGGEFIAHSAFWKPTGLVFGYPFQKPLKDKLSTIRTEILAKIGLKDGQYWLPLENQLHATVINYSHYSETGLNVIVLPESEISIAKSIVANTNPIRVSYKGALITNNGLLLAKGFVDDDNLFSLRNKLKEQIEGITQRGQRLVHVKLAQILVDDVPYERIESINRLFSAINFGDSIFTEVKGPRGELLRFKKS